MYLMDSIRYQVFRPSVTTMANCSEGCGSGARGGGTCVSCLAKEMNSLFKTKNEDGLGWGDAYVKSCMDYNRMTKEVVSRAS